jgi:hypothetical protein
MFYFVVTIQTTINTGVSIGAILLAADCLEVSSRCNQESPPLIPVAQKNLFVLCLISLMFCIELCNGGVVLVHVARVSDSSLD